MPDYAYAAIFFHASLLMPTMPFQLSFTRRAMPAAGLLAATIITPPLFRRFLSLSLRHYYYATLSRYC
jgi:hypothetical protein